MADLAELLRKVQENRGKSNPLIIGSDKASQVLASSLTPKALTGVKSKDVLIASLVSAIGSGLMGGYGAAQEKAQASRENEALANALSSKDPMATAAASPELRQVPGVLAELQQQQQQRQDKAREIAMEQQRNNISAMSSGYLVQPDGTLVQDPNSYKAKAAAEDSTLNAARIQQIKDQLALNERELSSNIDYRNQSLRLAQDKADKDALADQVSRARDEALTNKYNAETESVLAKMKGAPRAPEVSFSNSVGAIAATKESNAGFVSGLQASGLDPQVSLNALSPDMDASLYKQKAKINASAWEKASIDPTSKKSLGERVSDLSAESQKIQELLDYPGIKGLAGGSAISQAWKSGLATLGSLSELSNPEGAATKEVDARRKLESIITGKVVQFAKDLRPVSDSDRKMLEQAAKGNLSSENVVRVLTLVKQGVDRQRYQLQALDDVLSSTSGDVISSINPNTIKSQAGAVFDLNNKKRYGTQTSK